jgi:hypothetical protein
VENEFPDAMCVLNGVGGRYFGIDAMEKFAHRVAMPGVSLKSAADLVGEADSFRHAMLPRYIFS